MLGTILPYCASQNTWNIIGFRAAGVIWQRRSKRISGVDISEPILLMACAFLGGIEREVGNGLQSVGPRRFLSLSGFPEECDLMVAAFVLGDLPDDGRTLGSDQKYSCAG